MLASYAALPRWAEALELIDEHLTVQAPTFFHEIDRERRTATTLYMRAFGTFRGGCRLALSGQVYETTVLVRSIIESGVHAWACGHSEAHRNAWEARSNGSSERTTARQLFTWGGLMRLLHSVASDFADRVHSLYEQTIEQGAHPNIGGVNLS